jgi:hypothetical protein
LHARKRVSASKVWGRRPAPVDEDQSELARALGANRRGRW